MSPGNKTNKRAYIAHAYSGPRKSLKKVRCSLKRHTGETSRDAAWRVKKQKTGQPETQHLEEDFQQNTGSNNQFSAPLMEDSPVVQVTPVRKTYGRPKPIIRYEAPISASSCIVEPVEIEPETPMADSMEFDWPEYGSDIEQFQLPVEVAPNDSLSNISGYRIVDLEHVLKWAFHLEKHRQSCESSLIGCVNERRNGFHSDFTFKCTMCDKKWCYSNEKSDKVNTSFVWGTVTSGSYYTQAAHITSLMDIPTIPGEKFRSIEKELGNTWYEHLTEEIKIAGEQERLIAIEKGNICSDGMPYITVYVDGGWLKRSYGHNFDSSSGMACIIGKETKKCLFLGVRNKYCYTCHYYERKGIDTKEHSCCKNFVGPSTAMESDIIVEGFQKSEEMHSIRYLNFIGDGDSSVYSNLKEKVSYGTQIKKTECKNHVIKNYTSALYKILSNTKLPNFGRNILKPKLKNLTITARKIIVKKSGDTISMAEDLRNSIYHVFGLHEKCKQYYCTVNDKPADDTRPQENQVNILKNTAPEVWALIYAANERIALKAGRLSNETTNVVENFMSVINKYNCGKRINFGRNGSYQRRIHIAGLSHSTGYNWHQTAWKKQTSQSPGKHFKKFVQQKEKSRIQQRNMKRRRLFPTKEKSKPDEYYGPEAIDPIDIDESEFRRRCDERMLEMQVSADDISLIESRTLGQHDNPIYVSYRSDRLTASQFGMVCKRRDSTPCHNHVKDILYKKDICTRDMMYGQQNEIVARELFKDKYKKYVRPAGLFIDGEFGFLAASPDGIIEGENALIEIKCFPSLARKSLSIETAAIEKPNFPVQMENNVLIMNKKHNYYYQVQGQLRVTKLEKCYFICFIDATQPWSVIEVYRDEEFINKMIPKLVSFFKFCILPEIILRRANKNGKCLNFNETIEICTRSAETAVT